jgi:hypothetical protein
MPNAKPSIGGLGHDGAEWLRAEAALLRHDLKASAHRGLGAASLCLLAFALLLVGLVQASHAVVIGLTPITGSTLGATTAVASGSIALAAVMAMAGFHIVRSGSLSRQLASRLSAAWAVATERTR